MHAITMPTFQPAPDADDDDIPVPVSDLDKLTQARYAIDKLIGAAQRHGTAVLAPIAEDLTETFLLLIPAAVYVDDCTEQAAS